MRFRSPAFLVGVATLLVFPALWWAFRADPGFDGTGYRAKPAPQRLSSGSGKANRSAVESQSSKENASVRANDPPANPARGAAAGVKSSSKAQGASASTVSSDLEFRKKIADHYDMMLSEDYKKVMQLPYIAAHQLVQKEGSDLNWSAPTSQVIADRLHADFSNRLDVSMVDCRTDICEIRVNSKPGNDYNADLHDFYAEFQAFKEEPWYAQYGLDDSNISTSVLDNEIPVMVVFITRR
ncbi:MAG TPA: hypothetical protein VF132_12295 [Rudaea sp.]